jgi:hypothetical protein
MSEKRAYSILEIKAADDEKRILTGVASTPTPDLCDDVMVPEGAVYKLPIPFLWQHDRNEPIGHVTEAKVSPSGITVTIQVAKVNEPGKLKDRLDASWLTLRERLVRGLSIGFVPIEYENIEGSWGRKYLRYLWTELSAVTLACNTEAMVTSIKSLNGAKLSRNVVQLIRAADGRKPSTVKLIDPRQRGVKLLSK